VTTPARHAIQTVLAGDGTTRHEVACGVRRERMSVPDCLECERFVRIEAGSRRAYLLCCDPPIAGPTGPTVASIMTQAVVSVRPEVSREAVTELVITRNIGGVPVVDARGCVVGMVSKSDLLRHEHGNGCAVVWVRPDSGSEPAPADCSAEDLMTPMVFSVPADAPIAQAAAMMAYESVHRVAVIAPDNGQLVGILSALDIARHVARLGGYLDRDPRP
jgi:CBS domain-containing protein